uniref:XPG N-terminal domain-containing protein n=1 Tax=Gadus morhua TaxID=8049 RepID=A0A8C5A8K3_GADMO
MGVKGLWSLLEDYSKTNSEIYEDIHFRDSKLVVDGSILAHLLYNMANLDQNHGGEYLPLPEPHYAW